MNPAHNANLVLFIVGPPGVGKTTLVRALMNHLDPSHQREIIQKPKWTLAKNIFCAAGHYVGSTFDGADTVGYNQSAETLSYWRSNLVKETPVTIFDGDRFSTRRSLDFVTEVIQTERLPHKVRIVHLNATDVALDARRVARGSNQNAIWMKGRVTKAANFAKLRDDSLLIDTSAEGLGVDSALGVMLRGLDTAWQK